MTFSKGRQESGSKARANSKKEERSAFLTLIRERSSPYLERYVLEALCRLGRVDLALERMRARYAPMIRSRWTTLWEEFPTRGTSNHAWAGGPLYILSAYVAGMRPIEPGFAAYAVEPQPGPLKRIKAVVATVRGEIRVRFARRGRQGFGLRLVSPRNTEAHVALPVEGIPNPTVRVGGRVIWRDGKPVGAHRALAFGAPRAGRIWTCVKPGTYQFHVTAGRKRAP